LDISIKFAEEVESFSPLFFKGSIEQSLKYNFGEIGGNTTVDIVKFDKERKQAIIRVPENYYVKTRASITLISKFQGVPCHFQVNSASPIITSFLNNYLN